MKIDDALMWRWIELLSIDISLTELAQLRADVASGTLHPRDIKLRLARELATRFPDEVAAEQSIAGRAVERRGREEGVRTGRSRWGQVQKKKKKSKGQTI